MSVRPPASWLGKLLPALLALVALVIAGTIGFHLYFGSPAALGLYQTLVTMSTLGDARIQPHTTPQYTFLATMSVLGYAAWGLSIAVVTGLLVSIDIRNRWGGPTVIERIRMLHGHTIVVGGGRVGHNVAGELHRRDRDVVVLEKSPEQARRISEAGLLVLVRDALEEGALEEAGLSRAGGVVLALPDDAQNLYALLAIRDLAPDIHVVARAETARAERHLRALGVQRVVMPTAIGGKRLARLLLRPLYSEFLDTVIDEAGFEIREHSVTPNDSLVGVAVRDIRGHLGEAVTLLAIHRGGRFLPMPPAETEIQAGDSLLLVFVREDEAVEVEEPQ
jgi:voltage-gated potassium channel